MGVAEWVIGLAVASLAACAGLWLGVALVGVRLIREDLEAEAQE